MARVTEFGHSRASEAPHRTAAEQISVRRPVLARCRDLAIAEPEPEGIRGGLTPRERVRCEWPRYWPTLRDRIARERGAPPGTTVLYWTHEQHPSDRGPGRSVGRRSPQRRCGGDLSARLPARRHRGRHRDLRDRGTVR
ncbi:WhiB family transcriptional regulator [Nocardia xishanensis]